MEANSELRTALNLHPEHAVSNVINSIQSASPGQVNSLPGALLGIPK